MWDYGVSFTALEAAHKAVRFPLFAPYPREPPSGLHVAVEPGMATLEHDRKNTRGLKNRETRKEISFLDKTDEQFFNIFELWKVYNRTFVNLMKIMKSHSIRTVHNIQLSYLYLMNLWSFTDGKFWINILMR